MKYNLLFVSIRFRPFRRIFDPRLYNYIVLFYLLHNYFTSFNHPYVEPLSHTLLKVGQGVGQSATLAAEWFQLAAEGNSSNGRSQQQKQKVVTDVASCDTRLYQFHSSIQYSCLLVGQNLTDS